ncbi:uncharacterized protein BT62DRAFT_1070547 [Guyanagaster necrorhizus]|uniref:Uncharacterized protein n=1 Tax=Guyanagaster necrorhizus TaxID=856835 RepID=A0A9P8B095_9AGAR|nr:uncharacterized protein BT62DRAFT_1070547 [Guyanagaster necrorhizus MCA 3950]KAG7452827.1 hypothetical protein BT62DRAFT_1070547 [Guyanagaster necrorhizus MCA 3950]
MTPSIGSMSAIPYLNKVHQCAHRFVTLLGDYRHLVLNGDGDGQEIGESPEESFHYDRVTREDSKDSLSSLLPPVAFSFTASRNPGERPSFTASEAFFTRVTLPRRLYRLSRRTFALHLSNNTCAFFAVLEFDGVDLDPVPYGGIKQSTTTTSNSFSKPSSPISSPPRSMRRYGYLFLLAAVLDWHQTRVRWENEKCSNARLPAVSRMSERT